MLQIIYDVTPIALLLFIVVALLPYVKFPSNTEPKSIKPNGTRPNGTRTKSSNHIHIPTVRTYSQQFRELNEANLYIQSLSGTNFVFSRMIDNNDGIYIVVYTIKQRY